MSEKEERYEEYIYRQALETYGAEAQICMVFEEMSELQKELCKSLRNDTDDDWVAEEIADVEIMLEQMKLFFVIEEDVEEMKEYKIKRLAERLGIQEDNYGDK